MISFDGINDIRGIDFPFSRGVSPSSFCIYGLPVNGLDNQTGTLTLEGGVTFSGCAIAAAFIRKRRDSKWPIMAVHGFDRRWKWRFSRVAGDYNRRMPDGTVDPNTIKTPAELASLCLQAIGEGGFDTSNMPTGMYPPATWKDCRADLALQALCDYVACDVVLNPLTDAVEIWPLGVGASAPDNGILPNYRYTPRANVPSTIQVVCGDSYWQSKLQLKATARNGAGVRNLINSVDYKPSTGWDVESPFGFPGVSSTANRISAYEQVWKEFSVMGQQDGSLGVGSFPFPISSIDQYVLSDTLLETENDLYGFKRNLPCYVDGDYYAYTDLPNNASSMRYSGSFELAKDRRLMRFPFPIFKLSSSGAFNEPTLYLTTAYRLRTTTGEFGRLYRYGSTGLTGSGTLTLKRPEIFSIYSTSTTPGAQTNTEAQATAEADAYVSCFQRKYQNQQAGEVSGVGFVPVALDGNIAQVSYSMLPDHHPCTTISEQIEHDTGGVPKKRRMLDQMIERLAETL